MEDVKDDRRRKEVKDNHQGQSGSVSDVWTVPKYTTQLTSTIFRPCIRKRKTTTNQSQSEPKKKQKNEAITTNQSQSEPKKKQKNEAITTTNQFSLSPYLPHELILCNILTRLSVKSLRRLSSVCKVWCSTVGGEDPDPEFVSKHLNHSKRNPSILGVFHVREEEDDETRDDWPSYYKFISFDPTFVHPNFADYVCFRRTEVRSFTIGYCNGLFCIISRVGIEITNLSTREVLMLPLPPPTPPAPGLGIARFGFGFDPLNNEYKVLQLVDRRICLIFTLGGNSSSSCSWSWRQIPVPTRVSETIPDFESKLHASSFAIHVNGVFHWLLIHDISSVISFDLHSEQFIVFRTPPEFPRFPNSVSELDYFLLEFEGHLCCGFQDQKRRNGKGFHTHLFWLLNDPFSQPNQPPRWKDLKLLFPPTIQPSQTALDLTSVLGHFVFYYIDSNKFLIFMHPHLSKVSFINLRDSIRPDLLPLPKFIYHIENILPLKKLLPPSGAGADQIRCIDNQDFTSTVFSWLR